MNTTYPKFDNKYLKKIKVAFDYKYPTLYFEFVDNVYEIPLEEVDVIEV